MTNPLLSISKQFPRVMPDGMTNEEWEEFSTKRDLAYSIAMQNGGNESKRLAVAVMQTAIMSQQPENFKEDGSTVFSMEECAAHFVPDAFTAMLIGLALYRWWNDTVDAACTTLNFNFNIEDNWEVELQKFLDANPSYKPLKDQPGYVEAMAARMNGN